MSRTKKCRTCGVVKSVSEYGAASKNRDGLNIHCKPCAQDKRRASKARQLDNMTIEELEAHEEKTRQNRRRWAEKNPEKERQSKARTRLRRNIPKWRDEADELRKLLADYDALCAEREAGRSPANAYEAEEVNRRFWVTAGIKLKHFARDLAADGRSTKDRDVIESRIEYLEGKLANADPEDVKAAYDNLENPQNCHGNLPRSVHRQMEGWRIAAEQEQAAARSQMTPEERAAERAEWQAFYDVTTRELTTNEMLEARAVQKLRSRAEAKWQEFRARKVRRHVAEGAQADADTASDIEYSEESELISQRYRQLYPQYLEEELAKDRAAKASAGLLDDLSLENNADC